MKRLRLSPGAVIALGFCGLILLGALLLRLPAACAAPGHIGFFDALFTAASASCVTGLVVVDTGTVWSGFGKTVILVLIQLGGLGVAAVGTCIAAISGNGLSLRDRTLLKEGWNVSGYGETKGLLKRVLLITLCCELLGAALSFLVFIRDYPLPQAVGLSLFHSVSAFNNAGFDLFGGMRNLTVYGDNTALNLITMFLILSGGMGYLAILDILSGRPFRRWRLQTKAALLMTLLLTVGGMLLIRLAEPVSWMSALFQSVTCRTAGFNTVELSAFHPAGLLTMCFLMFVGANPGSTGGGTKTTTLFALALSFFGTATGKPPQAFRRRVPDSIIAKAFTVLIVSLAFSGLSLLLLCLFEPDRGFMELLFEELSAFCTVGLSIASTPTLGTGARVVLIFTMLVGRVGPLTIATLLRYDAPEGWSYSQEGLTIG